MSQDLDGLRDRLREFAAVRDWEQFATPRNLALALAGEVGELCAELQWEPEGGPLSSERLEAIRGEMADVLIYLVRLGDVLDIDLLAAARRKMRVNARKYPVRRAKGNARKYNAF